MVNLCFKIQTVTRQDLCNITSLWTLPWMDPISTWGIKTKYLPYCRIYYESLHLYCTERCAISPEIKFRRQNSGIATDSNLDNCEFKHWTKCQLSLWENALIKKTIFESCSSHEKFDRLWFPWYVLKDSNPFKMLSLSVLPQVYTIL